MNQVGSFVLAIVLAIALATGCSVLGGCSTAGPLTSVGDARVVDITDEAVAFSIDLDLENRGDEPLPLKNVRYTVSVDGVAIYQGLHSAQATLGPASDKTIPVPAVIGRERLSWSEDIPDDAAFSITGHIGYEPPDRFFDRLLDQPWRRWRSPITGAGTLPLR